MRSSQDLYSLITSLSKSEKRYFRLFTSIQGGKKNYMSLFEAIDAQEEYDESALKEKFAGEKFVRQFNVAKKYLYDLIMKSLLAYHQDSTVDGKIKELLRMVEILHERGLDEQARKSVAKAVELAEEHQKHTLLLEALSWKRTLEIDDAKNERDVQEFYSGQFKAVKDLMNNLEYQKLYYRAWVLTRGNLVMDERVLDEVQSITNNPLLQDEGKARSIHARFLYHYTWAVCHRAEGGIDRKALSHIEKQLALIEEYPAFFAEQPHNHVSALNNRILMSRWIGDLEGSLYYIIEMERVVPEMLSSKRIRHPRTRAFIFKTFYSQLIGLLYAFGEYERIAGLQKVVQEGYEEHRLFLQPEGIAHMSYLLSTAHYGTGNMREALACNASVLEHEERLEPHGIPLYARLDKLVFYYEMGDLDHLEFLTKSLRRYLTTHSIAPRHPWLILELFERLPRLQGAEQIYQEFHRVEQELMQLADRPEESNMNRYFQYDIWIKGRMQGKSYGEIIPLEVEDAYEKYVSAKQEEKHASVPETQEHIYANLSLSSLRQQLRYGRAS